MKIENNLLQITNCMFKNRENWKWVTDEQKEEFSFIVNRLFSKRYPEYSDLSNIKNIDSVSVMNLWFHLQEGKPYPQWFWSKSQKIEKSEISEKYFKLLMVKLNINKEEDLIYLLDHFPEIIKEELKWFNSKTNK
jgi:hypothetical protein